MADNAEDLFGNATEEEADEDVEMASLSEQADVEDVSGSPGASAEEQGDHVSDVTPMVGAAEHDSATGSAPNQKKTEVHRFQITISLRDD